MSMCFIISRQSFRLCCKVVPWICCRHIWASLVSSTNRWIREELRAHFIGRGAATLLELNIFLMFLHLPQQRIQCLFNRKLTRLPLPSVFSQGEYLPFLSFDIPYRLTHHMIHQPYILHLLPLLAKIWEKVLKCLENVQPRKTIFYICWLNTVPWN